MVCEYRKLRFLDVEIQAGGKIVESRATVLYVGILDFFEYPVRIRRPSAEHYGTSFFFERAFDNQVACYRADAAARGKVFAVSLPGNDIEN
jgi:hypothetical protein